MRAPLRPGEGRCARRCGGSSVRRDRRRAAGRAGLAARRTTSSSSTCREDPDGGDPYEHAAKLMGEWKRDGVLVAGRRARDLGADAGLRGARRRAADPPRLPRAGAAHRVRRGRPPPRAHPARARRRTACASRAPPGTTSPRSSSSTPATPGGTSSRRSAADPWGEVTDADGTVHRVWRIADPAVHEAIAAELGRRRAADRRRPPPLRDRPHLRARGRRRGPPRLRADGLVSLEDPGLTVFATHRLLKDLAGAGPAGNPRRRRGELRPRGDRRRGDRPRPGRAARQLRLHGLPPPQAYRLRLSDAVLRGWTRSSRTAPRPTGASTRRRSRSSS